MRASRIHRDIFRTGSKTYFNSSLFFPPGMRDEVFILYAFVRVADNFVDAEPQDAKGFYHFREQALLALDGPPSGDPVIDSFAELSRLRSFERSWTEAFFHSMEMDLTKKEYDRIDETLHYIYGSAEVIGLFMVRIMGLPQAADHSAAMLGRSMQYINFIRDISEDNRLGRRYLPLEDSGLTALTEEEALKHPQRFRRFIEAQTRRYKEWQAAAESGYNLIPRKFRIPIKTAGEMYTWSAEMIESNPFIVFKRKVKPSKLRIFASILRNMLRS